MLEGGLAEATAPLVMPTGEVAARFGIFSRKVIPVARAAGVRVELLQATPEQLLGQMPEIQRLASQVRRDSNGNAMPWLSKESFDDKPTGIELKILAQLETTLMNRLLAIRKEGKIGYGPLNDFSYMERFHEKEAWKTGENISTRVGDNLSGKYIP